MSAKKKATRDVAFILAFFVAVIAMLSYPVKEIVTLSNCPENPWRKDVHYGDEVKIVSGFFTGSTGVVEAQTWINKAHGCNVPAFKLDVYKENLGRDDLIVAQDELEKK